MRTRAEAAPLARCKALAIQILNRFSVVMRTVWQIINTHFILLTFRCESLCPAAIPSHL